jgi:hypothetical protein
MVVSSMVAVGDVVLYGVEIWWPPTLISKARCDVGQRELWKARTRQSPRDTPPKHSDADFVITSQLRPDYSLSDVRYVP